MKKYAITISFETGNIISILSDSEEAVINLNSCHPYTDKKELCLKDTYGTTYTINPNKVLYYAIREITENELQLNKVEEEADKDTEA